MWGQGHRCGDGACPQEAHSLIEGKKTIDKVDLFSDGLDIQEGRDLKGLSPQERLIEGWDLGWNGSDLTQGMEECTSFSGGLLSHTLRMRVRQRKRLELCRACRKSSTTLVVM